MRYPGLHSDGSWALPERLNMAQQCLAQPDDAVAILDLTGPQRHDVTYGALTGMVDGLARALQRWITPGDSVGVLLSQSPWCAAAHLAIWKAGAISVPLFKLFRRGALTSRVEDAGLYNFRPYHDEKHSHLMTYTPSPAEAEFDVVTAGLGTIQLCL